MSLAMTPGIRYAESMAHRRDPVPRQRLETVFNPLRGNLDPFQKYYFNFMWPRITIYRLADAFILLLILEF